MEFNTVTVCLDVESRPNRRRHCWQGCSPNGRLSAVDPRFAAEAFRPTDKAARSARRVSRAMWDLNNERLLLKNDYIDTLVKR
ncbi:MAG: hypothetical protein LBS11_04885 [Oscillospiraceae bacterium]|jgi:hypothetical protein|nr:hypothetical protein [Oscillospiraceae bacterium]